MASQIFKRAFAFDDHTVSSTALALSDLNFTAPQLAEADEAYITVETQSVRYRLDGTAPTASVGHLVAAAGSITVTGKGNIGNFKIIRATGSDATVMVTLFKWS